MSKSVLVISGDSLPLSGYSTSGAGLRAWGLGEGLRSNGFQVDYAIPFLSWRDEIRLPDLGFAVHRWHPQTVEKLISDTKPGAVLFCHWPAVQIRKRLDIPTIIDFHGPHILERLFQNFGDISSNAVLKIEALRKADFFVCAGAKQKLYFLSWLIMAGVDVTQECIHAVPVCLSPDLPLHTPVDEVEFVYGGVYLPWQNPFVGLTAVADVLQEKDAGLLRLFGGKHPVMPIDTPPIFRALEEKFTAHPRVRLEGFTARDKLIAHYQQATVAVDLMAYNYERELAFTTRTVEYMWCGLPVIYNNYAELSPLIREYEAGWVLDPEDRAGVEEVTRQILADPAEARRRGANAQQLVRDHLTWGKATQPLVTFLENPTVARPLARDIPSFVASELGVSDFWQKWSLTGQKADPVVLARKAISHLRTGGIGQLQKEIRNYIRWQVDKRRLS
jgi:glycosyltransferase involved in cell wall biosynthesis